MAQQIYMMEQGRIIEEGNHEELLKRAQFTGKYIHLRIKGVKRMKSKKQGTLKRVIKMLFEFYPVLMPLVVVCVLLNAVVSSIPAIFMQNIIALVEQSWQSGDWAAVFRGNWEIL